EAGAVQDADRQGDEPEQLGVHGTTLPGPLRVIESRWPGVTDQLPPSQTHLRDVIKVYLRAATSGPLTRCARDRMVGISDTRSEIPNMRYGERYGAVCLGGPDGCHPRSRRSVQRDLRR